VSPHRAVKRALVAGIVVSLLAALGKGDAQVAVSDSSSVLRLGIVGLVHPHAAGIWSILQRKDVRIVGVSEPNAQRRTEFLNRGLAPEIVFSDESAMIEKTRPQAVLIYSSTYDHLRAVEIAAHYGVHAMMEKPLAVSLAHANAIARAARAAGIEVLVNLATTWFPSTTATYGMLHDNALGPARKIVVLDGHSNPRDLQGPESWLVDPKLNGGGALFDFGCYGANLVTWLMDGQRPTSVTAVTQTVKPDIYPRVDDEATIILTYPKAQAILQGSWNWPINRKDMEVYGEKGYAIAMGPDSIRVRVRGETEQLRAAPRLVSPHDDGVSYLKAVVLNGLKPNGPSSLSLNIIATEILDAARQSARTGTRIKLPLNSAVRR
jgi:predicted dehydrogenase